MSRHEFQSTRPARGATRKQKRFRRTKHVSIHAPRAGRDTAQTARLPRRRCFNPRAPRGARQATPSPTFRAKNVSIHAPRAGRDGGQSLRPLGRPCFNPRAPRGARRTWWRPPVAIGLFQSTRPARGATSIGGGEGSGITVSIHAPRAGRDIWDAASGLGYDGFNPRAPRGARPMGGSVSFHHDCFNPRAPRGARRRAFWNPRSGPTFQSTRPARGATT